MSADGSTPTGVLEDLRRAMTPRGRARLGCFAIEGLRLHERALRSGTSVLRAIAAASLKAGASERVERLLADLEAAGCRIHFAPDEQVAALTGGRKIGAIVGLVPLPRPRPLAEILERRALQPAVVLVAVEVEDPGNVGALVRTALACGAAAFVALGVSDPHHPRAVRTSMGSVFRLPIVRYARPRGLLRDLAALGVLKLGAVSSGGVAPSEQTPDAACIAIFLGSEAFGLPAALVRSMDRLLTVPMEPGVDSLSVNAVAAVLLYDIRRRVTSAVLDCSRGAKEPA